ncbi:hypothetical protein D3C81_774720 [compost metagenome]
MLFEKDPTVKWYSYRVLISVPLNMSVTVSLDMFPVLSYVYVFLPYRLSLPSRKSVFIRLLPSHVLISVS